MYLTGARVVAASDQFAHGSRYRAYGYGSQQVTAAIATKVSTMRAQRAAAGTSLVGQMRHPWLRQLAFGPATAAKGFRGELRLCGQHLSAFGDPEDVILFLTLRHAAEAETFAEALLTRVREDRLTWEGTTDEERAALSAARVPAGANPQPGTLPSVRLAGSYRISAAAGYAGVVSARSRPAADPRSAAAPAPATQGSVATPTPAPAGSRVCATASCDARGLATSLTRCDVCGKTTQEKR